MLWKMQCFTLQSVGRTNHKFPVHATRNTEYSNAAEIDCTHSVLCDWKFRNSLFCIISGIVQALKFHCLALHLCFPVNIVKLN